MSFPAYVRSGLVSWLLTCGTALALAAQPPADQQPGSAGLLTRAQMAADLDALADALSERWSYYDDKRAHFGVDVPALVADARSRLPKAASPAVFAAVLERVVAGLKDGHAGVQMREAPRPRRHWGFTLVDTVDGLVVDRVIDVDDARSAPASAPAGGSPASAAEGGSPGRDSTDGASAGQAAEHPGPRRGDRLLAVDGVPADALLRERIAATIASTEPARRHHAIRRLGWTWAERVTVRVARPAADGAERVLEFALATSRIDATWDAASRSEPAWRVDWPAAGIARLRVTRFSVDDWRAWLEAPVEAREGLLAASKQRIAECFDELHEARALILDLRGNGGGTDMLGAHLARHLLPQRFTYFQLSAKHHGRWTPPHAYQHDPLGRDQRFDGPLAILVDEACFSTTDNFLRAVIEQRDDVIVVGRPTHGGTGAPAEIATLPHSGARVIACTQRVYGPRGELIEGRGTAPDVLVTWTRADVLEQADPDLRAALKALEAPAP